MLDFNVHASSAMLQTLFKASFVMIRLQKILLRIADG